MDPAYISTLSALAGSAIGGLTSVFATWLNQRAQARAGQVALDLARREDLIRDFIVASSKSYGDAIVNNEPKMQELVDLYAMVSRMHVLAMPRAVARADSLMRAIIDTYFQPNRTMRDLNAVLKTGAGVDPVREFSEAAREELRAFALR
jgi:hypothetical protein